MYMQNAIANAGIKELKKRTDFHWARKAWHIIGVSLIAWIYYVVPLKVACIMIGIGWLSFIPFDVLRQNNPKLNQLALQIFKPILRQNEVNRLAGTTFLLSGVAAIIFIFPRDIVLLTLLILAFADPIASMVGIRFGKDKIFGNKSLQGSLAAFFVCTVITFGYMFYNVILLDHILLISLLVGLVGSLAELIPVGKIDDNFTLPIVSASAIWFLFNLFGS